MPLPTLEKTWQFDTNNILRTTGTTLTDNQNLLWAIKNFLVTAPLGAWTVAGSSDGTTAGMDAVDRWTTAVKLVWGTGAHSWIVLAQTGIAAGYAVLIDLNSATPARLTCRVAFASAFTGGGVSVAPTATDSQSLYTTSQSWHYLGDATFDCIWHGAVSTDGQCSRINICAYNNCCTTSMLFDKPKSPVTGWTTPAVAWWLTSSTSSPTHAHLNDNSYIVAVQNGSMPLFATGLCIVNSMIGERRTSYNDISQEWTLTPLGLVSETAGKRGRHATLYDIWWGSVYRQQGDTLPDDNTRQFVQFGEVTFPWDGTPPVLGL